MKQTPRQNLAIRADLYKQLRAKSVEIDRGISETANIVLERGLKDMNRPRKRALYLSTEEAAK